VIDDDETVSAYHESGHAVVGYLLGGAVESVGLYAEADEYLPERFGDCHVNWGRVDPDCDWQVQREMLTILAGPVAEMIYTGEPRSIDSHPPWQHDWLWVLRRSRQIAAPPEQRAKLLANMVRYLKRHVAGETCWPAVAAVADELLAHERLDAEQLSETLGFWIGR